VVCKGLFERAAGAVLLVREECPYTSSVVLADEWPRRTCTAFTDAPERISIEIT
jgi:hypothetical protein